jgi:hypothetical protein
MNKSQKQAVEYYVSEQAERLEYFLNDWHYPIDSEHMYWLATILVNHLSNGE